MNLFSKENIKSANDAAKAFGEEFLFTVRDLRKSLLNKNCPKHKEAVKKVDLFAKTLNSAGVTTEQAANNLAEAFKNIKSRS